MRKFYSAQAAEHKENMEQAVNYKVQWTFKNQNVMCCTNYGRVPVKTASDSVMMHVRHFVSVTVLLSLEHEVYFWKSWFLASKTWIEVADNVTKVSKWTMSMILIGHYLASKFQNSYFQYEATCKTFLVYLPTKEQGLTKPYSFIWRPTY